MAKSSIVKGFIESIKGFKKKRPEEIEQERQDALRRDFEARQATANTPVAVKPSAPQETEKEREAAGQMFITAREKAKSLGANKVEANQTANQQTQDLSFKQITPQVFQQQQKELMQVAGQVGQLTPEQQQRQIILGEGAVDVGGALAKGAAGLGAGAAAGTFIAPGIGTAIGAGVGFVGGAFTSITMDQRQDVKQALKTAISTNSNLNYILSQTNKGFMNPSEAVQRWNEELTNLYAAERSLKTFTKGKLGRELSGAMDERAKVEGMTRNLGNMNNLLMAAIQAPNPNFVMDTRPLDIEEQNI